MFGPMLRFSLNRRVFGYYADAAASSSCIRYAIDKDTLLVQSNSGQDLKLVSTLLCEFALDCVAFGGITTGKKEERIISFCS